MAKLDATAAQGPDVEALRETIDHETLSLLAEAVFELLDARERVVERKVTLDKAHAPKSVKEAATAEDDDEGATKRRRVD